MAGARYPAVVFADVHVLDLIDVSADAADRVFLFDIGMERIAQHTEQEMADMTRIIRSIVHCVQKIAFEAIERLDCQFQTCLLCILSGFEMYLTAILPFLLRGAFTAEYAQWLIKRTA